MKKISIRGALKYLIILLIVLGVFNAFFVSQKKVTKPPEEITGTQFIKYLEDNKIKEVTVITMTQNNTKTYDIVLKNNDKVTLFRDSSLYAKDAQTFDSKDVVYSEKVLSPEKPNTAFSILLSIFFPLIPFLLIGLFLFYSMKNQKNQLTAGMNKKYEVINFRNPNSRDAKLYTVTLEDVKGIPKNVRKELQNMSLTIQRIINKQVIGDVNLTGLLLYGAPGTGKSMIAKAIAASVRSYFIHVTGEFVDKFVGQGASNVQSLFDFARKISTENANTPVIIFVDEIDKFGKKRDGRSFGGNDERESTLNVFLENLSGVVSTANIFVIGATNLKDSLDPALIRSGRLSKHIEIPAPDKQGRQELFEYYLSKLPSQITLASDVDMSILAEYSVGMTGADIQEIKEGIMRVANGIEIKTEFNLNDIIDIIETTQYGSIREELMNDQEVLEATAIHEAGHAIVALKYFPKNVLKACVTPRDKALGYVAHNIMDGKVSLFKEESKKYIELTLGGMVAEKLFFKDTSSGVRNDLEQANSMARNLVQKYGAVDSLLIKPEDTFKEGLSDETMAKHENQMESILDNCKDEAESFLEKNKDLIREFANRLLANKVLNKKDIENFYTEFKTAFIGITERSNA